MPQTESSLLRPSQMQEAATALIRTHGTAALDVAALSASRMMSIEVPDEAAFWLGVHDIIRNTA